jgi:Tfp pilus assembly protein PilN
MTTTTEAPVAEETKKPRRKEKKSSFLSMEVGGKKKGQRSDEPVEERQPFAPSIPLVDLLSPSVHERTAVKAIRKKMAVVGGVVLVALAGVWGLQSANIASAQNGLDEATAQQVALTQKITALAPVKSFYQEISRQEETVNSTLASEILTSRVLTELSRVSGGVTFDSIAISYSGTPTEEGAASTGGCPNTDPFSSVVSVGCITLTGTTQGRAGISTFLTAAAGSAFFVNPYVTSTTVDESGLTSFSGTLGLSQEALSGRYVLTAPEPAPAETGTEAPPADGTATPSTQPTG